MTQTKTNGMAASQGHDAPVVNKNKRFRKDKRVTLCFPVLHISLNDADHLLVAWDTDDIEQ